MNEIVHTPVLLEKVLRFFEFTEVEKEFVFIDCTLGEAGHSKKILEKYEHINLIGIERDNEILVKAKKVLLEFGERVIYYNDWFNDFFENYPLEKKANFILADLGVSMFHYKESGRGFSFSHDEVLDMRLNPVLGSISAIDIVNNFNKMEIEDILYKFGEEHYSRRISKAIIEYRKNKRIETAKELEGIVRSAYPFKKTKINPSTKTFQALRIYVNDELASLSASLPLWLVNLEKGGILAVITFHSLEDRIVKEFFKNLPNDQYEKLTKKPLIADGNEIKNNKASRSAKLRVVKKLV